MELERYKEVLKYLAHRKWTLLRAPVGKTGFITSDHPVCVVWTDPVRRKEFKGPGHGRRNTQVLFSISNELAVVGAFEGKEQKIDASEETVAKNNAIIAAHADLRYVPKTEILLS